MVKDRGLAFAEHAHAAGIARQQPPAEEQRQRGASSATPSILVTSAL